MSLQDELIAAALETRLRAYAPESDFLVGAALATTSGQIFVGANVENASYGLTLCAERNAVGAAIARGQRDFSQLAIATAGGYPPCGACRQVLLEFCEDLPILLVDVLGEKELVTKSLRSLLPDAFRRSQHDS